MRLIGLNVGMRRKMLASGRVRRAEQVMFWRRLSIWHEWSLKPSMAEPGIRGRRPRVPRAVHITIPECLPPSLAPGRPARRHAPTRRRVSRSSTRSPGGPSPPNSSPSSTSTSSSASSVGVPKPGGGGTRGGSSKPGNSSRRPARTPDGDPARASDGPPAFVVGSNAGQPARACPWLPIYGRVSHGPRHQRDSPQFSMSTREMAFHDVGCMCPECHITRTALSC